MSATPPVTTQALRAAALEAFLTADPQLKVQQAMQLTLSHPRTELFNATPSSLDPGRPQRPALVNPRDVPQRGTGTLEGRLRLMHAVAHIEFNAINLALDACWRFDGLPAAYHQDWAFVAGQEAEHFSMVRAYLRERGVDYGSFEAHDGLWQMAKATAHDVLERMALVPRLMEARGLDVTPGMQAKLQQSGDDAAVDILSVILRDEIGHVAIGNRWYAWLCEQRGVDPLLTMHNLMTKHRAPAVRPPLNLPARTLAGFSHEELASLVAATQRVGATSTGP
jgi:uncharacterized ferritin-like protein (DUF455 family)